MNWFHPDNKARPRAQGETVEKPNAAELLSVRLDTKKLITGRERREETFQSHCQQHIFFLNIRLTASGDL